MHFHPPCQKGGIVTRSGKQVVHHTFVGTVFYLICGSMQKERNKIVSMFYLICGSMQREGNKVPTCIC